MNQIGHVCLVFFGAVLQAVTVEAKRGGGGGGKGKKGGGGGGGGGSTSGTTIGVVAGAVVGAYTPGPTKLSVLMTARSAIILLAVAIEKFRSRVTRFFEPRSCPQDDKPRTNKLKKRPDLERNTMQGYQPQDPPVYVSMFKFLVALRTLTRLTRHPRRHPHSSTIRWIGGEIRIRVPPLINKFNRDYLPSPPFRIWGLLIPLLSTPRDNLSRPHIYHLCHIHPYHLPLGMADETWL